MIWEKLNLWGEKPTLNGFFSETEKGPCWWTRERGKGFLVPQGKMFVLFEGLEPSERKIGPRKPNSNSNLVSRPRK